ncbi:sensor histidine kinase [bacterium]
MTQSKRKKNLPFTWDTFFKCLIILMALSLIVMVISILIRPSESENINSSSNIIILFIRLILILISLGIFSIVGAGLLAMWVEKPLNEFMTHAYEIGRGNFAVKLPEQKNLLIQHLARLIHYMANEMDRLKKINVHGIISEKNKTEALLRHIADGVIVIDMDSRILVMNSVVEKWFGFSEKQFLGKPIGECFRNLELSKIFEEIIQGKAETVAEFDYTIMDSITAHVFQAHAARVEDESKSPIGVIAVLRDVTKEREADRVKTELVSMVAHELKSPLTSIYGFSELLSQIDPHDSKFQEYAKVIMSESIRLTEFVNKFLDLSRLESGKKEVKKNPFDLQQVVNRLVETQKGITEKRNIRILTDFPSDMPLAMGDQDLIEQVLLNLFSNAVKYSKDHSKIGIEIKNEQDQFLVQIVDNGFGIPKEALPHIFNKFYRVIDDENEEEIEGSGLGLALVKEIIEQHGGTINVQSRIGYGSIFTFNVPKYQNSKSSDKSNNE